MNRGTGQPDGPAGSADGATNAYRAVVAEGSDGWEVRVVDGAGRTAFTRACAGESEAALFASTVRQHAAWLSPAKFREYYRIAEPVGPGL